MTLNNMEWNAYQVAKDSGDFMLARSFLFGDYVEPSAMLNSFRCQDPQNESGYCNPTFDGLLQQAADTLDGNARTGLYHQAEQLLMDEMPAIPSITTTRCGWWIPPCAACRCRTSRGDRHQDLYFSQQ